MSFIALTSVNRTALELDFTLASASCLFSHLEKTDWRCEKFSLLHCDRCLLFSLLSVQFLLVASAVFDHFISEIQQL